jgi:hypothetical protein
VPVLPSRRIRWWGLLLGLGLLALGLWLVLALVPEAEEGFELVKAEQVPEKEGLPVGPRVRRSRDLFDLDDDEPKYVVDGELVGESDIEALRLGGWTILVLGLAVTLLLGTHRPGRKRFCDVCGRDVIAIPRRGWRCERCNTRL